MDKLAWLLTGILIGGCLTATILCCIQINRVSYNEQELQKLRQKLNDKI